MKTNNKKMAFTYNWDIPATETKLFTKCLVMRRNQINFNFAILQIDAEKLYL